MVKMAREREVLEVADSKKRKICNGDIHISSGTVACSRSYVSVAPVSLDSSTSELSSTNNDVSSELACCASNGSSDGSSKFLDPDDEDTVDVASNSEFEQSRKKIIYSKLKVELHKLESTPRLKHVKCRRQMMPSEVELDEFFAAAEKDLLARSVEKYNFDFVKEKPLEGRYEWVRK